VSFQVEGGEKPFKEGQEGKRKILEGKVLTNKTLKNIEGGQKGDRTLKLTMRK